MSQKKRINRLALGDTPWKRLAGEFFESRLAVLGLILCIIILISGSFAPWIAPQNPYDLATLNILDSKLPPFSKGTDGMVHLLGTDEQGRDLLSAILYGLRTSLFVGAVSGGISLVIGVSLGMLAAFYSGRVESFIMRLVDLHLSLPAILVAIILVAILGQGIDKLIFAIVVVFWAGFARTVHGVALAEKNKEYVEAAVNMTLGKLNIAFKHILPNCLPPVIVVATMRVATAISLEATLSFLGVGLPVTKPSLGLLISNGFDYMLSGRYWISFYPGVALLITVIGINLVGDHLRDVLNPRLKR